MAFREETTEKEVLLKNPIFTLVKHQVKAAGGRSAVRYIIEHKGAAAIAALTEEGALLLVRQYRKALDRVIWEIPAGKIDPEEEPVLYQDPAGQKAYWLGTAQRELREETGWEAVNWRPLCSIHGAVGYCNERVEIWRADCSVQGDTDFDDTEDIDLYQVELTEALRMVKSGEITDAKTVTAILMLAMEKGLN